MNYLHTYLLLSMLILSANFAVGGSADALDNLRGLTKEWVKLEESYSKEKNDWEIKEAQLTQLILLADREINELQGKIESLDQDFTVAEEKREELAKEQKVINQNLAILKEFLFEAEQSIHSLYRQLPEPLKKSTEFLYKKIPLQGSESRQGPAERMQSIISMLSLIQAFDKEITISEEIKELPNGTFGEITTLYIGLDSAYYVTTSGDHAGYGSPSNEGWSWISQNELSDTIIEVIEIVKDSSTQARFLSLPVQIKN